MVNENIDVTRLDIFILFYALFECEIIIYLVYLACVVA